MQLITWELGFDNGANNELFTNFVPTVDADLYAVRLHLMIVGAPSGTVRVSLRESTGVRELTASSNLTITDFLSVEDNAHGMFRFVLDYPLKADTEYGLYLVGSGGYSYSSSSFVGWCAHKELRRITLNSAFLGGSYGEPLGVEFWSYQQTTKGVV